MRWLLLLFVSLSALAAPFRLKLVERRNIPGTNGGSDRTIRVYEIEGTPFRMEHVMLETFPVEMHSVQVFRGDQRETIAAMSEFMVFRDRDGRAATGSLSRYRKDDTAEDAKGLGELVLRPLLERPGLVAINAELSYSNFDEMRDHLREKGEPVTVATLNRVVLEKSHLGRVLKEAGYAAVPDETQLDSGRAQSRFTFRNKDYVAPSFFPSWGECWGRLLQLVGLH